MPNIDILQENLCQILRIIKSAVMLTVPFKTFHPDAFLEAARAVQALEIEVLSTNIEVVVRPVVFQLVERAIALEDFLVKIAPGTKEVFFVPDVNPIDKAFYDGWKGIGPVDVHLVNIGELPAKVRELRMERGLDESLKGTEYLTITIYFQSPDFDGFWRHGRGPSFPASRFNVVNDKIQAEYYLK